MTDNVIRHLRQARPDLIEQAAKLEAQIEPYQRNGDYRCNDLTDHLINYLRQEVSKKVEVPQTRLGMLDVIFELIRRVRNGLNLPDFSPLGKPLAEAPIGPWKQLPNTPVWPNSNINQIIADSILQSAYKSRPTAFYELAEQMRRSIQSFEIVNEISSVIDNEIISSQVGLGMSRKLYGEAVHRLFEVCEIRIVNRDGV